MFTSIDKALVTGVMAIVFLLSQHGVNVPEWFTEDWLTSLVALASPVVVWAWPNKGGNNDTPS